MIELKNLRMPDFGIQMRKIVILNLHPNAKYVDQVVAQFDVDSVINLYEPPDWADDPSIVAGAIKQAMDVWTTVDATFVVLPKESKVTNQWLFNLIRLCIAKDDHGGIKSSFGIIILPKVQDIEDGITQIWYIDSIKSLKLKPPETIH